MWGMGEMINAYEMLVENFKRRDHIGERGLDGRMILKWI
jgi:hypothetical protein